ncbi:MAG: LacI family DNA-binding transcriptional regulator [Gammaproteobacteria bacterium]|nr:LacI family DNA-binding transcriptional regulator [Gammaproteobacteria bacterium]
MPERYSDTEIKPRSRRQRKSSDRGASLNDVARQAKVSTATVSRVLNNPEKVAEKSRLMVQAAIDQLGYIPDGVARALASNHTGAIGAVVPTLDNAIFAAGVQGFQSRLKKLGYTVILASHEYDLEEEFNEVKTLLRQGIDALLLVGSIHDPRLPKLLEEKKTAYVNCWSYKPNSSQPYIGFDNKNAAKVLTDYLLDLGHRDIAVIVGRTRNNDRAMDRLRGIRQAIEERNLELPQHRILERSYTVKQGREAMRVLLQNSTPPTAVMCGNDILALGALAECQSVGIRVPEELSITGFDDLDISAQIIPPLTTIHVPLAEMGELAANFLVSQINNESTLLHTEMKTELMVRGTTAKPRSSFTVGKL